MKIKNLLFIVLVSIGFIGIGLIANANVIIQDADSLSTAVQQGAETVKAEKKIDWMQIIFAGSYLIGVFVLFPLVVYTNLKESLFDRIKGNKETIQMKSDMSEIERNDLSIEILERIEAQLDTFTAEDGTEMVTITSGRQARFMKRGLDYINTRLCPTDEDVLARVDEFTAVYKDRTKREFTGSKWILGCAIGLLVFMGIVDMSILLSGFSVIHIIGIVFYYLSSRTPRYALEKRMNSINSRGPGIVGSIMTGLFAGMAAKHYVSVNGGSWQRDHESEFSGSMITLLFLFVAAMFVAFLIALFGILNFVINYSTSFLNPLKSIDKWFDEDYSKIRMAA